MKMKPWEMKIRGKLSPSTQSMKFKNRCYRYNVTDDGLSPTEPEKPDERKNQSSMSESEKDKFKQAYQAINIPGALPDMVAHHADMTHMMHSNMGPVGTERFLPWHRVYLAELEELLQTFSDDVTIPYWDWTADQSIPDWLEDFTPTIGTINVFRQPGAFGNVLPSQQDVDTTMNHNQYTAFTLCLEAGNFSQFHQHVQSGMHNEVHVWVGGTMGNVVTAPADPLFWMHHANIDRIWDLWQKQNPNLNPNLAGAQATMDPWTVTEQQTRDTLNFGYIYI